MSTNINLKELERKAWRSTYEDGLLDIYYGLIVICMGFFVYRPEGGYSALNIIALLVAMLGCSGLLWVGKRWITLPRIGQVKFGPGRKKRKTTLTIVMFIVVLIQVGLLVVEFIAWQNPAWGTQLNLFQGERALMDVVVAVVGGLMVLIGMTLVTYFNDFSRGYYIAAMMSLAVFMLLWLNQPIWGAIIGMLITFPGAVLLVRFIRKYPVAHVES